MNTDQNTFLNACERKVAPLRSIMDDLALYGGKPPIDSLEKYNAMRAEALSLDFEIAQMLPPKKGEEKKVLDAMQRLEMLVNSVQTYAQIIEGEVKQAKSNFYNNRTAIVGELEKVEARADEQILVAMRDLAKALRIKWLATEKKFRLSQYLTGLGNEFSTMGENVPPPSIIYLPWSEKIQAIQAKFNEAYLRHFLDKIGLGDGLTVESFKQK